jgi:CBS domain-containing protein
MATNLTKILQETAIERLLSTPPVLVDVKETVEDTIQKMRKASIGCVLVLEDRKLAGIFTERDFINRIIKENMDYGTLMGDIMNAPVKTLSPKESVAETIRLMVEKGYRHIPLVTQSGRIKGLIRPRDIIQYFSEHFPHEIYNQPPNLDQIAVTPEGA